jgi:sugar phosphate permease
MMYSMVYAPGSPIIIAALLFAAGVLLNLGFSTFLVYPMGIATKDRVPFAASIVNTCGSIGGATIPFVVGVLLDHFNWDWAFGFLAMSAFLTLALLCSIVEPQTAPSKQIS